MILTHGANSLKRRGGGGGGVVEIGGRQYPTVKIGNLIWMAENLDYKDSITVYSYLSYAYNPLCKYYNEDESSYGYDGLKYGLLYNGFCFAAIEAAAPDGWRIPTFEDFTNLIESVPNSSSITRTDFGGTDNEMFGLPYVGYTDSTVRGGYIQSVDELYFGIRGTLWSNTGDYNHNYLNATTNNLSVITDSETSPKNFRNIRLVKDA